MATIYYSTSSATSTATAVWGQWCEDEYSISTATGDCWGHWTTATAASTTTATMVWRMWSSETTQVRYVPYTPPAPTQAELDVQRRRADEWKKKAEEEKKLREAAEKRATELLLQCLNAEQRASFKKDGRFKVVAGDGAAFEIEYGSHGNVKELDKKGNRVAAWCANVPSNLPFGDNVLAQKLLLETNPKEFRRIANRRALQPT